MRPRFYSNFCAFLNRQSAVSDKLLLLGGMWATGFNLYVVIPLFVSILFWALPFLLKRWCFRAYPVRVANPRIDLKFDFFRKEFVSVTVDGKRCKHNAYTVYNAIDNNEYSTFFGSGGLIAVLELRSASLIVGAKGDIELFAESAAYAANFVREESAETGEISVIKVNVGDKGEFDGFSRPFPARAVIFEPFLYPCMPALVRALDSWRANRKKFKLVGSSRFAILVSGPPGCGKSLLANAIAQYLGLRTICEAAVGDRVRAVDGADCVVAFHDIDTVFGFDRAKDGAPRTEIELKQARTLDSLMKYLDGDENPDSVVIFTTNYPERFDSALFRPGRIDYRFELGPLPRESAAQFAEYFYADAEALSSPAVQADLAAAGSLKACELCNAARRNIDDVAGFARDCVSLSRSNPR